MRGDHSVLIWDLLAASDNTAAARNGACYPHNSNTHSSSFVTGSSHGQYGSPYPPYPPVLAGLQQQPSFAAHLGNAATVPLYRGEPITRLLASDSAASLAWLPLSPGTWPLH